VLAVGDSGICEGTQLALERSKLFINGPAYLNIRVASDFSAAPSLFVRNGWRADSLGTLTVGRTMEWFRAFLTELNTDREYQQTFDRSLALLFGGFPSDLLPSLKRRLDLENLMRSLRANGNTAQESAVYAATNLISMLIGTFSNAEREAALETLERHDDPNNPTYKGFHYMLQAVEQLRVKPALLSRISYEIVGGLWGMSPEVIQAWWSEAEVPKLLDEIVKEEATAQKIAQRFAPILSGEGEDR
jgi:hypothetical protein